MALTVRCVLLSVLWSAPVWAQDDMRPWAAQSTGIDASLRGLCVVDASTVWASGSGGTVIRTVDAGKSWTNVSVNAAKELDFRDIHAFDSTRAVILSAGQPARVYQTTDGGRTWTQRYEHPNAESFFDALSFWDERHGIAMSDPVDMRVLLIETHDGGSTWNEIERQRCPGTRRGEAGFAASGTNMCVIGTQSVLVALGGGEEGQAEPTSRVVYSHDRAHNWSCATVPMPRSPSSGIFSMAFANSSTGIAVGGNYLKQEQSEGNIAITTDGGATWTVPTGTPPRGYRSGVAARTMGREVLWVAVGPTGTDVSTDNGRNWKAVSDVGFHAIQFSPDASAGFASGSNGPVARWTGVCNEVREGKPDTRPEQ